MNHMQESPQAICPLCSETTNIVLSKELRRGSGIVFYCEACQHGFLSENPSLDVKTYYADSYRQEYSHNAEAAATNAREIFEVYNPYQAVRLRKILPYLSQTTELLEVGASSGQFLVHIKDKVSLINAIELDKACCDFITSQLGIDADHEFLRDSRFAQRNYDILCAFQVLEHVPDPVAFIQELISSAKHGATIFLEVPNLNDPLLSVWNIEAYKTFYYHSAHLHYFTEDSLRKTAQLAGISDDQIEISFTQDYNLLNHLNWIMNNAPQPTCTIGLSDVTLSVTGADATMATWLTNQMKSLNDAYIDRLISTKRTSNMMMVIKNV